jgi:omega-amidase
MKIGFFQSDLVWENPSANMAIFEEKIAELSVLPDVLLLPEMFNAGFSMNYSEPSNFITQKWLQLIADRYGIIIAGSCAIKDKGLKFNRFFWAFPGQEMKYYDKSNLFAHGGENLTFASGDKRVLINVNDWQILPQVCFDLRFPQNSLNIFPHFDILVYVASWPEKRIEHWKTLLKARAIENQAYVIGVNRLGVDGNNLNYTGDSTIINFDGELIVDAKNMEGYFSTDLNHQKLQEYRKHYNFLNLK